MKNSWGRKFAVFQNPPTESRLYSNCDIGIHVTNPHQKKDAQEAMMRRTISSLRYEEVKKTRLEPYSSWATHQGVGGLESVLDSGLNLIPFKGDVVTISAQADSSGKMSAQRIVFFVFVCFFNITNMD